MIEVIAQTLGPMLRMMPKQEQARIPQDICAALAQWLLAKRTLIPLQPGEEQLVLMFTIDQRTTDLLMVPVVLTDDDRISRTMPEQGVNVSGMAANIPLADLLMPLLTGGAKKEGVRPQDIIAPLREAASHARLVVLQPAPTTTPQLPAAPVADGLTVSDMGEVDGDTTADDMDGIMADTEQQ